jgi:hypothetical protein
MTERSSLLDPDLIIYRCDFVHLECDSIQLYWLTAASGVLYRMNHYLKKITIAINMIIMNGPIVVKIYEYTRRYILWIACSVG